jgi:deoxyribodipyrimidine photo-lyase
LATFCTAHAPVGPTADLLDATARHLRATGGTLHRLVRPYDARAWPHATHGFFRFREAIPELLRSL